MWNWTFNIYFHMTRWLRKTSTRKRFLGIPKIMRYILDTLLGTEFSLRVEKTWCAYYVVHILCGTYEREVVNHTSKHLLCWSFVLHLYFCCRGNIGKCDKFPFVRSCVRLENGISVNGVSPEKRFSRVNRELPYRWQWNYVHGQNFEVPLCSLILFKMAKCRFVPS